MRPLLISFCLAAAVAPVARADSADSALMANAFEFMARASGTSEVLSLNLTNLLILLALKAVIFAIGLFSGGGGQVNNGQFGRSADGGESTSLLQKSDLSGGLCFMMYASGDAEKLSCVQRAACEDPKTAADYLTAAKMWYKMHKLMR